MDAAQAAAPGTGPAEAPVSALQEDTKDRAWWTWSDEALRKREPQAVQKATETHKDDIERFIALQFLFDRQWKAVKVRLVGLHRGYWCS